MATEGCKRNRFQHPSPVETVSVLVYIGSVAKMNRRSPGTGKDMGQERGAATLARGPCPPRTFSQPNDNFVQAPGAHTPLQYAHHTRA
jgi:hypothetical protein